MIFGRQPVLEYLSSGKLSADTVLTVSKNAEGKAVNEIIEKAKSQKIKTIRKHRSDMDKIAPGKNHQGVMLRVSSVKQATDYKDLIENAVNSNGIIVYLDQLTDPHNIGSIIRTAEALGAEGIVMPKAKTPEINSTIVKTSAGATAHIPVLKVSNGASFLDECKKDNIWIIGSSDKATTPLSKAKEYKPCVIVIGNEGTGMRRLTGDKCDITVSIPMRGNISSLNAAVAAGILIHSVIND